MRLHEFILPPLSPSLSYDAQHHRLRVQCNDDNAKLTLRNLSKINKVRQAWLQQRAQTLALRQTMYGQAGLANNNEDDIGSAADDLAGGLSASVEHMAQRHLKRRVRS
jgi:hypothetical protein